MSVDEKTLQSIGLTAGESKVYLALLKTGQSTTGLIVKEAGVTTSKSYKILDRLEKKGLASHIIIGKFKHFKAASPTKILDLVKQQQEDAKKRQREVEKIIPRMLAYQKEIQQEHEVEVFQGIAGLQTLFNEQTDRLKPGQPHYVIGVTNYNRYPRAVAKFFERLQAKRDNKKIVSNYLLGENAKGTMKYLEKSKLTTINYIPYASAVAINIYLDTTIIAIFIGEPILIKITSQAVADNFVKYFELLTKISSKNRTQQT